MRKSSVKTKPMEKHLKARGFYNPKETADFVKPKKKKVAIAAFLEQEDHNHA
ncbi:MAG: hypothetical protein WC505_08285 [Patescibacteria group bacterium]